MPMRPPPPGYLRARAPAPPRLARGRALGGPRARLCRVRAPRRPPRAAPRPGPDRALCADRRARNGSSVLLLVILLAFLPRRRRARRRGDGRPASAAGRRDCRVPHPHPLLVLSGHAASLTPYYSDTPRPSPVLIGHAASLSQVFRRALFPGEQPRDFSGAWGAALAGAAAEVPQVAPPVFLLGLAAHESVTLPVRNDYLACA
mgnify:CR=1 FL=1|jgi:hypothetical protein